MDQQLSQSDLDKAKTSGSCCPGPRELQVTPPNVPTYLTVQGHILWYLKDFSFPQVMLIISPNVALSFLFSFSFFSETLFWQELGSRNGHHSNGAARRWTGKKDYLCTERLPPCMQRKAKALRSAAQQLCLDFSPGSVSRFMGTVAHHSTRMQLAGCHDVVWRCPCPTAQVPAYTQRMETPFTFRPRRLPLASQLNIQN